MNNQSPFPFPLSLAQNSWSDRMKTSLIPVYGEDGLQQLWGEACDGWQYIFQNDGGKVCEAQAKEERREDDITVTRKANSPHKIL